MIKLIGLQSIATTIAAYRTEDVCDIESGKLSDDCRVYEVVADHAMLWLDKEGFFGELECLFPYVVEQAYCRYPDNLVPRYGFPQLKVLSTDNICAVQDQGDSYTIWLARDKTIDDEIVYGSVHFLFADDELVGIKATEISIEPSPDESYE